MLISRSGIRIFNDFDLRATLEAQLKNLQTKIEETVKTEPLNDKSDFIMGLAKENEIKILELYKDKIKLTSSQQMIPAEFFPPSFFVSRGKNYPKEVISFHLPFSGDKNLLKCVPSARILWTEEVYIDNNEIVFEIINFNNNAAEIKGARDRVVDFLLKQAANVNNQVTDYNSNLVKEIENAVNQTEKKASEHSKFLSELGTPVITESIKQTENQTETSVQESRIKNQLSKQFDVFICHASEDKSYADELAEALIKAQIEVWLDSTQLSWGDDLRPMIDEGLKNSRYGIVVFSKAFKAKKKWTEYELNGLFEREKLGKKVILPIWHNINRQDLSEYSPTFADRIGKKSTSMENIIQELKKLLNNND